MPLNKETLAALNIDQDLKDKILNLLESNDRNLLLMQQGSEKITDLNADLNIAKGVNADLSAINTGLELDNNRLRKELLDHKEEIEKLRVRATDAGATAYELNTLKGDYEILDSRYKALCSRFGAPANL